MQHQTLCRRESAAPPEAPLRKSQERADGLIRRVAVPFLPLLPARGGAFRAPQPFE